jgi:hypothetical protein
VRKSHREDVTNVLAAGPLTLFTLINLFLFKQIIIKIHFLSSLSSFHLHLQPYHTNNFSMQFANVLLPSFALNLFPFSSIYFSLKLMYPIEVFFYYPAKVRFTISLNWILFFSFLKSPYIVWRWLLGYEIPTRIVKSEDFDNDLGSIEVRLCILG